MNRRTLAATALCLLASPLAGSAQPRKARDGFLASCACIPFEQATKRLRAE